MHEDLIRDLTLRKLPVIFQDACAIDMVRDLAAAGLVTAIISRDGDSRPHASVLAIAPAVRAAQGAKRLTRVHFVGGHKDGEHLDLGELVLAIGFPPSSAGRGRTLYELKRGWHLGKSWLMYVREGTPERMLHRAAERLSRAGVRSS